MPTKRQVRPEDDPLSGDSFRWPVGEAGYRWEPRTFLGTRGEDRFAYTGRVLIASGSGASRKYNPLAEPELFRKFAECRIREPDMAEFAGTYGMLGVGEELDDYWRSPWPKGLTRALYGERLFTWQNEILAMRAAFRIWQSLKSGSVKDVPIFVLPEPEVVGRWSEQGEGLLKSADDIDVESVFTVGTADDDVDAHHYFSEIGEKHPFLDRPTLGSADAAWGLLIRLVNRRLLRRCGPYLFDRDPNRHSLMVRVAPQNLLGAIWWQFGRVVSGESKYRPCKVCERPIELSKGDDGFRSDRVFCSPKCKSKDHREKVKQVKQLRTEGLDVKQIAKRFETDPATVKRWLKKKK
jgi:hypothetical protein